MRLYSGVILFVCVSSLMCQESTTIAPTKADSTTPAKPTEPPTTTTSSTAKPTTTSPVPTTTSPAAKTTTSEITTHKTEAPTTVTSVAPSTTDVPSTTEAPVPFTWDVKDTNGTVCIKVQMKVEFLFSNSSLNHQLSTNATDSGHCGNETQSFGLDDGEYKLEFTFAKSESEVYIQNISVSYPKSEESEISGQFFKVSKDKSYVCKAQTDVHVKNVTLRFKDLQIEAFGVPKGNFKDAQVCEEDQKLNSIVPIAVACILAAMVVIILISYLVFRRQSRQRGYESV